MSVQDNLDQLKYHLFHSHGLNYYDWPPYLFSKYSDLHTKAHEKQPLDAMLIPHDHNYPLTYTWDKEDVVIVDYEDVAYEDS